jgi:tetratricopeptide (TPR) repeat protein
MYHATQRVGPIGDLGDLSDYIASQLQHVAEEQRFKLEEEARDLLRAMVRAETPGNMRRLRASARRLVARWPYVSLGYAVLGYAYARLDQLDDAFEELHHCLGLNAADPVAHLGLGHAFLNRGNREQALHTHRELKAINPSVADVLLDDIQAWDQSLPRERHPWLYRLTVLGIIGGALVVLGSIVFGFPGLLGSVAAESLPEGAAMLATTGTAAGLGLSFGGIAAAGGVYALRKTDSFSRWKVGVPIIVKAAAIWTIFVGMLTSCSGMGFCLVPLAFLALFLFPTPRRRPT